MDIRNFTQFVDLLVRTQTVSKHPSFNSLVVCMMVYNSICACGGQTDRDKSNKQSECNRIYRESLSAVESVKPYFFQTTGDNSINFYIDNIHLIKTIFR